jgi:hypothetical protein
MPMDLLDPRKCQQLAPTPAKEPNSSNVVLPLSGGKQREKTVKKPLLFPHSLV